MYIDTLSYSPELAAQAQAFVTVSTCDGDQEPFSSGVCCDDCARFTIDPETLETFWHACKATGLHPALVLQRAIDNAMHAAIAAASHKEEA